MQELDASTVATQFVKSLSYPIARPDILAAARRANLADEIVAQLERIPEREYQDREELTAALNSAA